MKIKQLTAFLISLLFLQNTFSQKTTQNNYPAWGQPIIKRLMAKDTTVMGFGISGNDKFINIAILDKAPKVLYWISCEGYIVEATQLTNNDYAFLVNKEVDPFQLHHLLYQKDIKITDNAIQKFRFPKDKFYSRTDPNYNSYITQVLHLKQYDTLKTPLEKLSALYQSNQQYIYHLAHAEIAHPLKVQTDSIYKKYLTDIKKGSIKVSEHTDSIGTAEFYNKDQLSPIYKAVLNIPTAKLYFYQSNQIIFDSITVNRKQIVKLIDEGTDVFALYQNYTLWQLTALDSMVKQLHDYYTNKQIKPQQKKATEILLAGYNGSKSEFVQKIYNAEGMVLQKLNALFGVDKNYLEQDLLNSFTYSRKPIQYGEYIEGKSLVLAAPTTPYNPPTAIFGTVVRGEKLYQLTDQRGNVMAVVTDKKIQHSPDGVTVDYYMPDIVKATDYSSFGAPLPGRTFEITEYKYGYNGKENDKETGYQDYGMRMYDPNIGRFLSVDPLTSKFPYYTPYQFSGNSPIKFIDLDGLEPAEPDQKEYKGKTWAIDLPYQLTGGDNKYAESTPTSKLGTPATTVDKSKFFGNSVVEKLNRRVNTNNQFILTNETAFKTEQDLVNQLLGDFAWGIGPENIVFPENGKFSTLLKSSVAVGETLVKWAKNNYTDKVYNWQMDGRGEANVDVNSGFTSLEHFLGSVAVKIGKVDANQIKVEIFNITSFTSGYLTKDIPVVKWFVNSPSSTVRDPIKGKPTYSNTSQYFSFTMSTSEADKLIKQFNGSAIPAIK